MSDRDDVFDLADLQAVLGRATGGTDTRRVAVGVALAVVGASLALALVPHTLGAVGGDAVDTDGGIDSVGGEDAQQRYQNRLTNFTFLFAPPVLAVLGVVAAFGGAVRASGPRPRQVAATAVAAGVGVAVGYVLFVLVGHLAYGETTEGFIVEQYPVTLHFDAIAANAGSLGAAAAVGGVLAGAAGTVLEDRRMADIPTEASGNEATPSEDGWTGIDIDDDAETDDGVEGADATGSGDDGGRGGEAGPARPETSGPASDYRDTGPSGDSDAPRYDPDDRDWDGSGD